MGQSEVVLKQGINTLEVALADDVKPAEPIVLRRVHWRWTSSDKCCFDICDQRD